MILRPWPERIERRNPQSSKWEQDAYPEAFAREMAKLQEDTEEPEED